MALSTKENTNLSVLENFKISGIQPDYINIFRLEFLNNGQVMTDLKVYGSKEARDENPDSQIQVFCTNVLIPASLQSEIKDFLFAKIYPYLIAEIEVKNLLKLRDSKQRTPDEMLEFEEKIKQIYVNSSLESPF